MVEVLVDQKGKLRKGMYHCKYCDYTTDVVTNMRYVPSSEDKEVMVQLCKKCFEERGGVAN